MFNPPNRPVLLCISICQFSLSNEKHFLARLPVCLVHACLERDIAILQINPATPHVKTLNIALHVFRQFRVTDRTGVLDIAHVNAVKKY